MGLQVLLSLLAACVILLSFAAGLHKSYWSGCMKAATVICQQIFSILALVIFLLKILLKSVQNRLFFALASRSGFGPAISDPIARSSIVFCNSVFADRIVMAASRLLLATAACVILLSFAAGLRKSYWSGCMKAATVICEQTACVILLSFAAGLRKSYWSGCMKAATVICQQISSILALVMFLLKILLKSASKSSFFRSGVEIRFWTCNFRPSCA